jgi:hypothetical protein
MFRTIIVPIKSLSFRCRSAVPQRLEAWSSRCMVYRYVNQVWKLSRVNISCGWNCTVNFCSSKRGLQSSSNIAWEILFMQTWGSGSKAGRWKCHASCPSHWHKLCGYPCIFMQGVSYIQSCQWQGVLEERTPSRTSMTWNHRYIRLTA